MLPKTLDLTGHKLKLIPGEVFKQTDLEELCLDDNQINEIPTSLTQLIRRIYHNNIVSIAVLVIEKSGCFYGASWSICAIY